MKTKSLFILLCVFFSIHIAVAQERSKPRNGEGSIAFLQRHGYSAGYLPEFERINKGKFGKNKSLLLHVSYILPEKGTKGKKTPKATSAGNEKENKSARKIGGIYTEPLFGKKYQDYSIKSTDLAGACFYLVSGHGGPDCGATTKINGRTLHEDEYAYDVMLRLARNLLEHGATVHIIIQDAKDGIRDQEFLNNSETETCMGKAIPRDQKLRLKQRCDKINELSAKAQEKYERAIFIHLDSQGHKKQLDVYFYHQQKRGSERLAETMRNTFRTQYKKHQPNRGFSGTVSYRSLYVLNNTNPVSIFAELANMQNEHDRRRYLDVNNRQAMANWMLRGFVQDYKNSKK
ncbi:MAG: N-acetylmuramoyl-L-alanine amidase [Bacteroidales bacterium]|nr:N-acetylmuramoyl-L-alanine amidase [Bacteroidales bacterium]